MARLADEEIVNLWMSRKSGRSPILNRMVKVRDTNNGDVAVPLPEIDQTTMPAVANLLQQGVDAIGQRIASNMPYPQFPVLRQGIAKSVNDAMDRRTVMSYWWDCDRLDVKLGRAGRRFAAYASSYTIVKPDMKQEYAARFLRDPLTAFPSEGEPDDPCVMDCIFNYDRDYAWVKRNYPDAAYNIARNKRTPMDEKFSIVEWVDDTEQVMVLVGKPQQYAIAQEGSSPYIRLEQVDHRADMCPVAAAGRICLDREIGQFDGMIGMYQQQAIMMALDVIAVRRGIFPDMWWIGRNGMTPKVIRDADGLRGVTGLVQDAEPYQSTEQPGYKTDGTMDRLERAQRLDARIPAEFGGESGSNIRTGRRGDAVLAAVVDFPVQEAQRVFARALRHEDDVAISMDRNWWGNTTKTIWMGERKVTYTPNVLWTVEGKPYDYHQVTYSHAGSDVNGLAIGVLQRVGAGTMSAETGMELDPMIEDAEREKQRVTAEGLNKALLQGLQVQAAQGAIPPDDIGRMIQLLIEDNQPLYQAVANAQKEAQSRQATPAPQGAPETQPGLAQPGAGAEQPTIPQETPGTANLAQMLHALRAGGQPQGAAA